MQQSIAVVLLAHLNEHQYDYQKIDQLSNELSVSQSQFKRIIKPLKKSGYIETKEGINGGIKITEAGRNVDLYQYLSVYNYEFVLSDYPYDKICSPCQKQHTCRLNQMWKKMRHEVIETIKRQKAN